jgi:uncharacterized delta-60 repeat protein
MRLNANGTRDDSFGTNGIVQMAAAPAFTGCYPYTSFQGMRLQVDGRIIAAGYTSVVRTGDNLCFQGKRFAVTRWTANGQAESLRYLDNNTTYNDQKERATAVHFIRDGSKIIVSGSYDCKASLVRLNVADLSIDRTFGTNGIAGYAQGCQVNPMFGPTLYVKAIQPDGKFIGVDTAALLGNVVRLNSDGSNDQSFGNESYDGTAGSRGRLRVFVTHFNGVSNSLEAGQILVRPDGRMNLIGYSAAHGGLGILRAAVSQHIMTAANENPIDDPRIFVNVHYYDFLSREPDQGGLDYWTAQITQCGTDQNCINSRRIGVSAAFFVELEFQQTGYVVYRMYRAAYGTLPAPAQTRANILYSQFTDDRPLIVAGAQLDASTKAFADQFVKRAQFKAAYPDSMTPTEFVNKLYDTAGLSPFTSERAAAIQALTNNQKTRAQVLLDVIEIPAFKTREYNPSFVLMQYFGYLKRDPDQGGYDFWLNVLNNKVANNYRAMVCAFITSAEYQLRFGSTVTHTNQECSGTP